MQQDQTVADVAGHGAAPSDLDDLKREIARLRRTLLKHGHAQELFQHLDLELERTTFEDLIRDALDGTLPEVDRALDEARLERLDEAEEALAAT